MGWWCFATLANEPINNLFNYHQLLGELGGARQYFVPKFEDGNIEVDANGGRMSVQNPEKIKIFKMSRSKVMKTYWFVQ